jgi:hypothetical protein
MLSWATASPSKRRSCVVGASGSLGGLGFVNAKIAPTGTGYYAKILCSTVFRRPADADSCTRARKTGPGSGCSTCMTACGCRGPTARDLVIVRLGLTHDREALDLDALIGKVLAALPEPS